MSLRITQRAPRSLILSFGRVADGNAVSYVADGSEAELVLDLLDQPRNDRLRYATQLANFVREQERLPLMKRQSVAFRKGGGVFRLMPWRLAKWLSLALAAHDLWRERTRAQIRAWLGDPKDFRIVGDAQEIGR